MSWIFKNPFRDMPGLGTHDGRRAWAFLAIVGGAMTWTMIIIWIIFMLREHPDYLFYLALAGNGQVFTVLGAIGWAMGRRSTGSASKDGFSWDDRPHPPTPPPKPPDPPLDLTPEMMDGFD